MSIEPHTHADRAELEAWLRRDPGLHIYELGDLDPFFWPHTRWLCLRAAGARPSLRALALLYTGAPVPALIALARPGPDTEALAQLLAGAAPELPDHVYAHLTPGLSPSLTGGGYAASHRGPHLKLLLPPEHELDPGPAIEGLETLSHAHLAELEQLYARSYPGNWFDPRMLETGQYLGLRRDGALACVAGIHVYSPSYAVAALGNVTTAPRWRGRGLARHTVAALCRQLQREVEFIGLNVHADNTAALACYHRLGFEQLSPYDEWELRRAGS